MPKHSFIHYFVQVQKEGEFPMTVFHSQDEETKEFYHKFLDRKKANALLKAEKKASPDEKFRVVKCTETYDAESWS